MTDRGTGLPWTPTQRTIRLTARRTGRTRFASRPCVAHHNAVRETDKTFVESRPDLDRQAAEPMGEFIMFAGEHPSEAPQKMICTPSDNGQVARA